MTKHTNLTALIAVTCLIPVSMLAESSPVELRWNELASMIVGHQVEAVLADGAVLSGEAVTVRETALVMDVKEVHGAHEYQRGSATIPRAEVTLIKVQRTRGSWGRSMGTVVGVLSGVSVGSYVAAFHTSSASAGIPTFVGMASGMSLSGYYIGRQLDRRLTLIRIIPDKNSAVLIQRLEAGQ